MQIPKSFNPSSSQGMTRAELIRAVQVYPDRVTKRPYFISIDEIPEPWRAQFFEAIQISACPVIEGFHACAYSCDWKDWVNGHWYGGEMQPVGLMPDR